MVRDMVYCKHMPHMCRMRTFPLLQLLSEGTCILVDDGPTSGLEWNPMTLC